MCFSSENIEERKLENWEKENSALDTARATDWAIAKKPSVRERSSETCVSVFSNNSLLIQFLFEDTSRRVDRRVPHVSSIFSSSSTI